MALRFSGHPGGDYQLYLRGFLKAEGEEEQRKKGAYYTPSHLAEMVVDTAVEGWDSLLDKKALDPS